MVASSQPHDEVGIDILKKGVRQLTPQLRSMLHYLMEPTGSGVGGDLFAIVWDVKLKTLWFEC
jgi:gamma-glutamyltranspeptidase/glutathione hydrolase